jgi:predicted RNA-binding Zn ribbon-like protein
MSDVNTHAGNVRLVGGRLCLDFVNTVDDHTLARPKEYWIDYAALVAWGRHAGALGGDTAELLAEAARRPANAGLALDRARHLRAALYRIFTAAPSGQRVEPADLAALNEALGRGPVRRRIAQAGGRLAWDWDDGGERLEQITWQAAWSAADLMTSEDLARVRECAGAGCSWLFLDTSRSGTRRWCSMDDCGNRAKARRHYAHRKAARR